MLDRISTSELTQAQSEAAMNYNFLFFMQVIKMESQSSVMGIGMVGLDMEVEAEVVLQDAVSVDVEGGMVEICSGNQNITTVMVDQEPCLLKASVVVMEGLVAVVKVKVSDPMAGPKDCMNDIGF